MKRRGYMSPPRLADMIAALRAGESFNKIGSDNGISPHTVRRWLKPVIDLLTEYSDSPHWLAKMAEHRAPISEAQKAEITERLKSAFSLRQIAQDMNLNKSAVTNYAKPVIAAMREAGTIGLCDCGKARFHPRLCLRTASRATEDQLRRRIEITAAILAGGTFAEIAKQFGLGTKNAARAYLRHMTPAQRERRKGIERRRNYSTFTTTFRPFKDSAYARIAAAMPRWLSEAARDDAISDMYLAHLEGTVTLSDTTAEAKNFANRTVAAFESKFGPRSLDEQRFEDSDAKLKEMLDDPAALEAFDYIFEDSS